MAATTRQILLLSDNERSVASLEGALGVSAGDASPPGTSSRGQFHLRRLTSPDQVEQCLPGLVNAIDAVIVDGTAPCFSNGQLERTLLLLDRNHLGAVLLTPPGAPPDSHAAGMPLVWQVPADQPARLEATLAIMAGYQQVVRQISRELRLFQRLDNRLSGQFNELDEEMRLASRIQQDFLPKRLRPPPGDRSGVRRRASHPIRRNSNFAAVEP